MRRTLSVYYNLSTDCRRQNSLVSSVYNYFKMPYVYIGKRNFYFGKRLWEIVGNLKNFGEGRLLVRSKFERYPEVSYVKIIRAEPLMDEVNALMKC